MNDNSPGDYLPISCGALLLARAGRNNNVRECARCVLSSDDGGGVKSPRALYAFVKTHFRLGGFVVCVCVCARDKLYTIERLV